MMQDGAKTASGYATAGAKTESRRADPALRDAGDGERPRRRRPLDLVFASGRKAFRLVRE